jgi:hypothetical protein
VRRQHGAVFSICRAVEVMMMMRGLLRRHQPRTGQGSWVERKFRGHRLRMVGFIRTLNCGIAGNKETRRQLRRRLGRMAVLWCRRRKSMRVLPLLRRRGWAGLLLCESFLAWPLYTVVLLALDRLSLLNSSAFLSQMNRKLSQIMSTPSTLWIDPRHIKVYHMSR